MFIQLFCLSWDTFVLLPQTVHTSYAAHLSDLLVWEMSVSTGRPHISIHLWSRSVLNFSILKYLNLFTLVWTVTLIVHSTFWSVIVNLCLLSVTNFLSLVINVQFCKGLFLFHSVWFYMFCESCFCGLMSSLCVSVCHSSTDVAVLWESWRSPSTSSRRCVTSVNRLAPSSGLLTVTLDHQSSRSLRISSFNSSPAGKEGNIYSTQEQNTSTQTSGGVEELLFIYFWNIFFSPSGFEPGSAGPATFQNWGAIHGMQQCRISVNAGRSTRTTLSPCWSSSSSSMNKSYWLTLCCWWRTLSSHVTRWSWPHVAPISG